MQKHARILERLTILRISVILYLAPIELHFQGPEQIPNRRKMSLARRHSIRLEPQCHVTKFVTKTTPSLNAVLNESGQIRVTDPNEQVGMGTFFPFIGLIKLSFCR